MPALDGTGPRGEGPFSGQGEGYCAVRLPNREGERAVGFAGLQGHPVRLTPPVVPAAQMYRVASRQPRPVAAPVGKHRVRRGCHGRRGRRLAHR